MEVDAFLILVLSVYVAPAVGAWVLADRRRALRARRWPAGCCPWLRGPVPPRYWGKVVAAVQGVVLTVAAADVLPAPVDGRAALVVALVLLAESFGREVVVAVAAPGRPRARAVRARARARDERRPARPGRRRARPHACSPCALVWFALIAARPARAT